MDVLILTCSRAGTASRCLPELVKSSEINIAGVIYAERGSTNRWSIMRRKLRKIKKIGLLGAINGLRIRKWYRGSEVDDLEILCARYDVAFYTSDYLNSDETARLFKLCNADLGLSLGNGYIAERIYSIPNHGMMNLHTERLPQYQNAQSVIWPIFNNETVTGITIHQIVRGIDMGPILYQEEFPIIFKSTLEMTVRATIRVTESRVPVAIRRACERYYELSNASTIQAPGNRYTTPSITSFIRMLLNNRKLYKAQINSQR